MKKKTYLTESLEVYGDIAKYDQQAKTIIANPIVLSKMLKALVKEVSCFTEEEIAGFIADVSVSKEKGKLSEDDVPVELLSNEDINPKQGKIIYDIRFNLIIPKEMLTQRTGSFHRRNLKLLFDIEIQKDYYPGYDLVSRGEYYCSRMISAERGQEFKKDDFNNLKKVYSIWICVNSSKNDASTIAVYEMKPEIVRASTYGKAKRKSRHKYDFMNLSVIGLNDDSYIYDGLFGFLGTIFTEKLTKKEKIETLENRFGLKSEYEVKEVEGMCNVGELIYEKGIKRGLAEGMEKGRIEQLIDLVKDGILKLSVASERAHMSEEEFALLLK